MNRIWIGCCSGMNLKSAIRNLKFAIMMVALLFALRVSADAQQPQKVPRIGYLSNSDAARDSRSEPFRLALRERGYIEGQNIAIEY